MANDEIRTAIQALRAPQDEKANSSYASYPRCIIFQVLFIGTASSVPGPLPRLSCPRGTARIRVLVFNLRRFLADATQDRSADCTAVIYLSLLLGLPPDRTFKCNCDYFCILMIRYEFSCGQCVPGRTAR